MIQITIMDLYLRLALKPLLPNNPYIHKSPLKHPVTTQNTKAYPSSSFFAKRLQTTFRPSPQTTTGSPKTTATTVSRLKSRIPTVFLHALGLFYKRRFPFIPLLCIGIAVWWAGECYWVSFVSVGWFWLCFIWAKLSIWFVGVSKTFNGQRYGCFRSWYNLFWRNLFWKNLF